MLSQDIQHLQESPLVCHPGTRRIDSIVWLRLEMLRLTARRLELALGAKKPSGIVVEPRFVERPQPINPRWASAMAVFGD